MYNGEKLAEGKKSRNRFGLSIPTKKWWIKQGVRYHNVWKTSKYIVRTSRARTHISSTNVYTDCSYNYRNITLDHDFHPRYLDVDERVTLQKSQRYSPAWVPIYPWCSKHDIYGHNSSVNNQQKGRLFRLWMPKCLKQCEDGGTTNDRLSLLSPTDRSNV